MKKVWLGMASILGLGGGFFLFWRRVKGSAREEALAEQLDLPVSTIRTIAAVESKGADSAIRFEPHLFLRRTATGTVRDSRGRMRPNPYTSPHLGFIPWTARDATQRSATDPRPVNPVSKKRNETNRAAFDRAYAISHRWAVESSSWGAYQVLGEHLIRELGSPEAVLAMFTEDPATLSDLGLVAWFHANPSALRAAREEDWDTLALIYNGSGNVPRYSAALARENAALA